MSARTRKRARMESDPNPSRAAQDMGTGQEDSVVEGKKDHEFWYEDGNIDMFSLPQPPDPAPLQAGGAWPVVHLTDSPDEVRHLLRVCLPKADASRYASAEPTYDEIASLIHLGHKYQMPQLVDSSISYLKRYYPDDFDTYEKLDSWWPPKFKSSHAIGVVNLARLTGCMELLPAALLSCCLLGTVVFTGVSQRRGGPREQLTPSDLQLCYFARSELAAAAVAMVLRICRPKQADLCKQSHTCQSALLKLISEQHLHADQLCKLNPLVSNLPLYEHLRDVLCRRCFAMLEERDVSERRAMWKKLPDLLGIVVEGWAADDSAATQAATV
ncbi:hypothetical protein C8T65DRAFT_697343 [Cerioporus squamosus]|nr:hypothetical protein C8T65DRAFT_697343 [Cerioporus squamosus]